MSKVVWKPTRKQYEYLAASEDEVLFGGGLGGGKSEALVIDVLGLSFTEKSILNPRYRGLILRKSHPALSDIVDRAKALYSSLRLPPFVFNETHKEFRFASGAKIRFSSAETVKEAEKFQGQEFQYIAFEELTQWPTSDVYEFLRTRLRGAGKLPKLMRATCNPGGLGHVWVKNYFKINDAGDANRHVIKSEVNGKVYTSTRRFIPSLLKDNKHISDEYVSRMSTLSEAKRKALLQGRWDCQEVLGQVYKNELDFWIDDNRVRDIPIMPDARLIAAWDLGMSDNTSIIVAAIAGNEVHIIDLVESSGQALSYYVKELNRRGYNISEHFLPHDIRARELGTGKSRFEILQSLMPHTQLTIVKNMRVEDGIEAVRTVAKRIYFKKGSKAEEVFSHLNNYTRKYDPALQGFNEINHDIHSHCADAFRYLAISVDRKDERPALGMRLY